jgi:hypothetical protein
MIPGVAVDFAVAVAIGVAITIFQVYLRLFIGELTPVICPAVDPKGAWKANTAHESSTTNSRSPSPACPSPNGEVIHVETKPRKEHPHQRSKYNVKPMVSIVEPPRCGDEKCSGGRDESDDHQRNRRCRGACANRGSLIFVTIPFNGIGWKVGKPNREFGA